MKSMASSEGRELLENLLRRRDVQMDKFNASALLYQLDHLPLAITQAAAFLHRRRLTIPQYMGLFQRRKQFALPQGELAFVSQGDFQRRVG